MRTASVQEAVERMPVGGLTLPPREVYCAATGSDVPTPKTRFKGLSGTGGRRGDPHALPGCHLQLQNLVKHILQK